MTEKNKAEIAVDTLVKECGFSKNIDEYESCCKKPESKCLTKSNPFVPKEPEYMQSKSGTLTAKSNPFVPKEPEVYELVILVTLVLWLAVVIYFFIKKGVYKKILPPYNQETKAIFWGWVIWCFGVFSYSLLFEEYVNYWVWLTLPAICVIAIYLWVKGFVLKKP